MKEFIVSLLLGISSCVAPKPFVFVNEELRDEAAAASQSAGFKPGYIIYQYALDAQDDGVFDGLENPIFQGVISEIPSGFEGPIVIDWEGNSIEKVDHVDADVTAQFMIPLRYLKEKFPKAAVGYYAFPRSRYYQRDGWEADFKKYSVILSEATGWFPSIYDFYYEGQNGAHLDAYDIDYVKFNIQKTLQNKRPGVRIYPYVWHRLHECCTDRAGEYVGDQPFYNHVHAAVEESFGDVKIDGIIWWGADYYMLRTASPGSLGERVLKRECGEDKSLWESCLKSIHIRSIEQLKRIKP